MNLKSWYVARVRPNQHHRAVTNLERQGYRCFLPQRATTKRIGRKLVESATPLFPGYVFVSIGVDDPWRPVRSTYGVGGLVMASAERPQPVPQEIMEELFERTGPDGLLLPAPRLAPGDRVRIDAGPMSGFVARIEALPDRDRADVLLQMMGQAVRVGVSRSHLVPIEG